MSTVGEPSRPRLSVIFSIVSVAFGVLAVVVASYLWGRLGALFSTLRGHWNLAL